MIKKKKLIEILYLVVLACVPLCTYFFELNINIVFIFNLVLAFIICIKAKFSLISIQTVLINYILLPVFFQYNYGSSYGILEKGLIPVHYAAINYGVWLCNFMNLFFILNTSFLEKEKGILTKKIDMNLKKTYITATLAIVFTLIALPSLPFQTADARNLAIKALLPGSAWNHFAMVCLIFCIPKLKESKFVKFSFAFTIFWFLSHFERVDVLGLILLLMIIYLVNVDKEKQKQKVLYIGILCVFLFLGMTAISKIRVNLEIHLSSIVKDVLVHNTVSDVAYTFNAAIHYNDIYGNLNGKTYKSYLIEAIPLLDSDLKVEKIIQQNYATVGGNYLLGEPYMNFGILGILLFKIIELFIFYTMVTKKSNIFYFWYLFIIATCFRSMWYGLSYIETGMLYMVPLVYLLIFWKRKSSSETNIE